MMKSLGYFLVTAGFLAGAYYTVVQTEGVPVAPYLTALGIGVIGIIMIRTALRLEASQEDKLAANLSMLGESLSEIVARVDKLDEHKDEINVYDLRHEIDKQLPELLDRFVQARKSVAHRFGLQAYADMMNPFAAGERYINRVWSASTDGYIEEAHKYLGMAREQFDEAGTVLERIRSSE